MSRDDYKFGEDADEQLIELLNYIEENTGLRGSATSGRAQLSAGGNVVMITASRKSLDHQSTLLRYVENHPDLRIRNIGVKSLTKNGEVEKHPSINVEAI
jgi:hypothetical protein